MSAHTFSFYSADLMPSDAKVWITDDEHFHLARVLRMGSGDTVRVTNGHGLIVTAEIDSVGAKRTTARVANVEANLPEPVPLVLALGLLPRAHMDAALTQCVEAGITGFIPVAAERCHAKRAAGRDERWMRIAIAAMKQSGRGWLPRIEAAVDVKELITKFGAFRSVLLADADAAPFTPDGGGEPVATLAIVGPEAGFTDFERLRIQDGGARAVRISAQRLRAETAAVALSSMLALDRPAV